MLRSNRILHEGVIGIDIDNVLSDSDSEIRKIIDEEYGIKSTKQQITHWNYSESLPITIAQERKVLHLFHTKYCIFAPPIPFATEALIKLSNSYSIWLITCRPIQANSLTKQWLEKHNIIYDHLLYNCNKSEYKEILDFLIEDNGETAIDFAVKGTPVILFDQPWNTAYFHNNIFRVNSWRQALQIIETTESKDALQCQLSGGGSF